MPKVMVQNNNGAMVQVQLPHKRGAGKHDSSIHLGPVLQLPPGVKMVDKAIWDVAKQNEVVQAMLKERVPKLHAPEQDPHLVGRFRLVEGRELPDESPLAKLKPTEVLKIITETLDVETLKTWLKTEQRAEVRKAMQAQIDELLEPYMGKGGRKPSPSDDAGDEGGAEVSP